MTNSLHRSGLSHVLQTHPRGEAREVHPLHATLAITIQARIMLGEDPTEVVLDVMPHLERRQRWERRVFGIAALSVGLTALSASIAVWFVVVVGGSLGGPPSEPVDAATAEEVLRRMDNQEARMDALFEMMVTEPGGTWAGEDNE